MIENNIIELAKDASVNVDMLCDITDKFRVECEVEELKALLGSDDSEIVAVGAHIVSEIDFDKYNYDSVLSLLYKLTEHEKPIIRLYALRALYPALNLKNESTKALLNRMKGDSNEGVRCSAEDVEASLK